jgi:amino acid adenylation domain-containing protein
MPDDALTADESGSRDPLTSTQKGLLFHEALDSRGGSAVHQLVCRLREKLDTRALEEAFHRLERRHEILRTSFVRDSDGELVQHVHPPLLPPIERRSVDDSAAGGIESFLDEERLRRFDPSSPPLHRLALGELSSGGQLLAWSFHHVLVDAGSISLLLDELLALYDECTAKRDAALADAVPFRQFTSWLARQDHSASEPYWRERLEGFTAPTPLPSLPLASHAAEEPGELPFAPGDGSREALRRLAPELGVEPATLLAAAWGLILARYSGESDVVFGVARSRRGGSRGAGAPSAGFFTGTIPSRLTLRAGETVASWLARYDREEQLARAHEHAPLVKIQKWSAVSTPTPLFESLLIVEEETPGARLDGRAEVELREAVTYPLALTATLDPMTLKLSWDRRRFDTAAMQRLAGHLLSVLDALPQSLELGVERIPLLTRSERLRIVEEWNDTRREYPRERLVHELFEERAALHPERTALRFRGETLSYASIESRSRALARQLEMLGVGPGSLVAILLDRSPAMVSALLAVLRAGGAYVPLDPSYPPERIAFMLEDSGSSVIVTQRGLEETLPPPAGGAASPHVVVLGEGHQDDGPGEARPAARARPDDPAYVIYTSGSTGKPKGVRIPHRALVNFLHSMRSEPGLAESDIVLALTTLSFDIAGLEIWLPLVTGSRIELVDRDTAGDPRLLASSIEKSGATVVQATPATWRMLLEAGWTGESRLKLLCGGEAMPRDLANRLLDRCGELWNMYGPTETTIWSTVHRVTREEGNAVPIGRPIANTRIYILDAALEPVPAGVAGELFIGGDGVALGYHERDELTAERFVPDRFSNEPGARMYRTGDAARWLPDGSAEYLARLDTQVKLRGYRIELGEIEAALRSDERIADAVVSLRDDAPGGSALVAYLVAKEGSAAEAAEIRSLLASTLPSYMIPAYFVPLATFPLTPNGKIDRKALPSPAPPEGGGDRIVVAPRDDLEARLAAIWREILGVSSLSVDDDFFELGGESLLAVQLFVRIEAELGRELPLATLFDAPTIEALARRIREEGAGTLWSPLVAIQPEGSRTPFFCVHGVGGNVLNYRSLASRLGNDQPFYGLQARGLDGRETPLETIGEMAATYIAEIRKVQRRGPYLIGGASFGGVVAFEMAQQLLAAGETTRLVALFDTDPVNYGSSQGSEGENAAEQSFSDRMRVHLSVLLRGPGRLAYLGKKIRRLWRRTLYRSWQLTAALYRKVSRPLPAALQNVQQANYRALRDYVPRQYPGGVVLFRATGEPEEFTREKERGWRSLAAAVEVIDVPGDHITMVDEPHAATLAAELRNALDRAPR